MQIIKVRKIKYDVSDESENESGNESEPEDWRKKLKKPRLDMVAKKEDFMHKMRMHTKQVRYYYLTNQLVVKQVVFKSRTCAT